MASEQSQHPDKTAPLSLLDDIALQLMKAASVASRMLAREHHLTAQGHTDIAYKDRPKKGPPPDQK